MEITREVLLAEQAGLEQQLAQHREMIEKARNQYEAAHGALQMVAYLLKKLEEKPVEADNKGD